MSGMNSHSNVMRLQLPPQDICYSETHFRTFEEKCLFIVPVNIQRQLVAVYLDFHVDNVTNEYRNLWTNPEVGFYGYLHVRNMKVPMGHAIPITQRTQRLFEWYEHSVVSQAEALFLHLLTLQQFPTSQQPYTFLRLANPMFTDFSLGMQRKGKYTLSLTLWYFQEALFDGTGITPIQNLVDPSILEGFDPSSVQDLVDSGRPVDPPYEGEDDFGESDTRNPNDGTGELPAGRYRINWSTHWTSAQTGQPDSRSSYTDTAIGREDVNSVSGPRANTADRIIYHIINYVNEVEFLTTFVGSSNLDEWNEQKSNYTYTVAPI